MMITFFCLFVCLLRVLDVFRLNITLIHSLIIIIIIINNNNNNNNNNMEIIIWYNNMIKKTFDFSDS